MKKIIKIGFKYQHRHERPFEVKVSEKYIVNESEKTLFISFSDDKDYLYNNYFPFPKKDLEKLSNLADNTQFVVSIDLNSNFILTFDQSKVTELSNKLVSLTNELLEAYDLWFNDENIHNEKPKAPMKESVENY